MRALLPAWFVPKTLRHTLATWLRQRGVPAWDVSGLLGHHSDSTTDAYAKFDPSYMRAVRSTLEDIIKDLAHDIPRLRALLSSPP
jgi:integrase